MPVRVTDALFAHARARPDGMAVVDGTARITWAELAGQVESAARALVAQGLVAGDRVALRAADGAAAVVAMYAVLHAGGVHAPVDHLLADPEVTALMDVLQTPWTLRPARGSRPEDLRLEPTGHPRGVDPLGPGMSAYVRLSSGTTGAAKGVLLSHETILARIAAANAGLRITPDDRVLWLLPMAYHVAVSLLLYLQQGAALVFGNSLRASVTAAIARAESVTIAYASPYHIRRLAELPPGNDLPRSLTRVVSTTTALDATAAIDFRARHGLDVRQGLGIIEVGLPFVSEGSPGEAPGELGRPLPAFQVAILAPDGQVVPVGETGELAIAGPGLFDAYLQPWRTRAEVLVDGCFLTGDLAAQDDAGRIRLLGRCKDIINVGGVKVFPLEVEAVLEAHPWVAASRVRAMPDARTGDHVHADVQLSPLADQARVEAELSAWCVQRLAPLKRPAHFTFTTALERTASGKVRR
ncbi:MAG: long-chain fatty acid--CoA ligase [Planctomycetes bacterium]|nr:long-chain fatty acid--CoA ligase [Planctomycetota bacterium]